MLIRKAFRYRLYPTAEQEGSLAVQFGQVRQDYYAAHKEESGKKGLNYCDASKLLTARAVLNHSHDHALQEIQASYLR